MPTPRKPTALLKFEGSYYASRHGDRSKEPRPTGRPHPTSDLPEAAQEFWNRIVPQLEQTGVATSLDSDAIARMAIWYAEGERLKAIPQDKRSDKWIYAFQAADRNFRDYMARFGMTPSDRSKISLVPQEESDPAADFIA